jgi:hypothetical protein
MYIVFCAFSPARELPHCPQKAKPLGTTAPHAGQLRALAGREAAAAACSDGASFGAAGSPLAREAAAFGSTFGSAFGASFGSALGADFGSAFGSTVLAAAFGSGASATTGTVI